MFNSLLKLDIVRGVGLRNREAIGKSDPYVKVRLDEDVATPYKQRTHTIKDNLNPVWETTLYFLITDECKSVRCEVWDEDVGRDDTMGHCNILRRDPGERSELHEETMYLENGKGGTLQVRMQEVDLSQGLETLMGEMKFQLEAAEQQRQQSLLLEIRIYGCEGLKKADFFGKSDPFCRFNWSETDLGEDVRPQQARTRIIKNTLNPVFRERFYFIIPYNLQSYRIDVYDYDEGSANDLIGHCNLLFGPLQETSFSKYQLEKKGRIEVSSLRCPMNGLFPSL